MGLNRILGGGVLLMSLLVSCGEGKRAKQRVAEEREAWEQSLPDSLAKAEREHDSIGKRLEELNLQVGETLSGFRTVNNPREVEHYYLPDIPGLSYPLTGTGVIGRVMAGEGFELVAAYVGSPFDQLEVSCGGASRRTAVVPHDQALNYRSGNMTTVSFTGAEADSVGMLVSAGGGEGVRVEFLQNGKRSGAVTLPAKESQSIARSCDVAGLRKEVRETERRFQVSGRKIQLLRAKIESLPAPEEK